MPGYAATILQDTPNLYYRLGEAVGSTVVRDTSGHNFNGSLSATGVTLAEPGAIIGSNNTCYLFDGQTGLVTMPTTFNIAGVAALSVEAWINFTGTAFSNQPTIVGNAVPSISNVGLSLWIDTNASAVHIALGNGVANTTVSASYPFVAGTWYHIVATWDAVTAITLYVNGVSVATGALSGSIGSSTGTMTIAHNPYASNDYFPGQQDEVAFYPYGLSADRVLAHYNAGNPPNNNPGGLPGQKFVTVNGIAVSNFLFGTNMGTDFATNTVRNTPAIQAQVKSGGFQLMRCAIPDGSSNAYIDETANACIACGCQMLVILIHNDLAWNSSLVQYLGSRCNLYEFSNEPDLNGITYTQYYNLWAAHIPTLRSINPQAAFIGPVLGVYSVGVGGTLQNYLAPWLQLCKSSGNPQLIPDAISYHIYPCTGQANASICATTAPNIGNTVPQMNSLVSGILGHTLPLCVTEWNIDANDQAYTLAPAFNVPWTKTALDSMVANGLAMACQFECASGTIDMISTTSPYPPLVQYAPMVFEITKYLGSGGSSSTPLTTYLASATSASLATSEQLYTTSGTPAVTTRDIVVGTSTGFGELTSNGSSSSGADSPYGVTFLIANNFVNIPAKLIDLLVGGNTAGTGVEAGLVPGGPIWLRIQLRWSKIETSPGVFDSGMLAILIDAVTRCNAANILVDFVVQSPPTWHQTIDFNGNPQPAPGTTYIGGFLNQNIVGSTRYTAITVNPLGSSDSLVNGEAIALSFGGQHEEDLLVVGNYGPGATVLTVTDLSGNTWKAAFSHASGTTTVQNAGGQYASGADTIPFVDALASLFNNTTTNYLTGATQPALFISAIQHNEDYDLFGTNTQRDFAPCAFVTMWQVVGPHLRAHLHPTCKLVGPAVRFTRPDGIDPIWGLNHITTWQNHIFTYQPPGSSIVGCAQWLDALDFHLYREGQNLAGNEDPSQSVTLSDGSYFPAASEEVLAIKQVAANNGYFGMDVWCTETGWDVWDSGNGHTATVSFQQQSDYYNGPINSGNVSGGHPGMYEMLRLNGGSHCFIWTVNPHSTANTSVTPNTSTETKDVVMNISGTFTKQLAYTQTATYAATNPTWQTGWSGGTTIGAPSGRGWTFDGTTLDNQELVAGIYNGTLRLQATSVGAGSGTLGADLYRRGFKYTPSNGAYTQIVSTLISGQTIGSTAATYVTAGSGILQPFSAGEKFYIDEWANVTANTNGDIHQAIRLLNLSTDTGGHTGDPTTTFATPGFLPTPPSGGGTPPGVGRAFAMMRYGDGKSTSLRPLSLPVSLVYSIASSQYADPLNLSYRIEAADVAQVILSYTISPHAVITMNGDATIIAPDQITYTPRSVANRSLVGTPQLQNYMTMTWAWTVLQISEYAAIVSHYNSANPIVTLVYPDDMGTWVQRQVVMHPPTYGTQQMQQVTNVSITFTRLLY